MNRGRHVPIRTCLGCGARDARANLLRLVRSAAGEIIADPSGGARGRGGYLHPIRDCWIGFARCKGTVRSLRATVDRATRAALLETLDRNDGQRGTV